MENYQDKYDDAVLELQSIELYAKANGFIVIECQDGKKLRLNVVEEQDQDYIGEINSVSDELSQTGAYVSGLYKMLEKISDSDNHNSEFDIYEAIDHMVFLHNLVCGTKRSSDKLIDLQHSAIESAFADGYPKLVIGGNNE
jgi:hypothetical protein